MGSGRRTTARNMLSTIYTVYIDTYHGISRIVLYTNDRLYGITVVTAISLEL